MLAPAPVVPEKPAETTPESVTVTVTPQSNHHQPYLSEKTLAEMEEGRKVISHHARRV